MDRIGIELLSIFGLPPVQFVNLAADLDCRHISVGLTAVPFNPHGYPSWSLKDSRDLRREMVAMMRDRNVSISLGEGFIVRPGADVSGLAADLEAMCELGVKLVNTVSLDPDLNRSLDQFAALAEMVGAAGLETTVEFGPGLTIADLPGALTAIRHVGRPDFRLLIDTMHLIRSGSSTADVSALDPAIIGYIQLSDAPLVSKYTNYMEEAMFARMPPGTGELPLVEILSALPRDVVIGLEIPQLSLAEAGTGPYDRLRPCVERTREILARIT
ncbi:MAG: sugar phosphate isomerase/epimerase [Rhodospirillaceae bacterium]|nr:MAG: sugar phosphate isomerase/epimerase [Rhodospirillaceae bacterium]